MGTISRFDPFDHTFEPLLRAWLQPVSFREGKSRLKLDLTENDKAYYVSAEIAGVSKDQIEVAIEKNVVTISTEIKNDFDEKDGKKNILNERTLGKFKRSITLMEDIDADAAAARHVDGVLYLTLPKKASAVGRRLAVQ